jgi:hypothetical protein
MSLFNSDDDKTSAVKENGEQKDTQDTTPDDVVSQLVGEGKKFKTVEDALRGKLEADEFIERMKSEMETLKEQAAKAKTSEELLAELRKATDTGTVKQSPPNTTNDSGAKDTQDRVTPSEDDIKRLVAETMTQREREASVKKNLEEVKGTLKSAWGEGYVNKLSQVAEEMNLSKDRLEEMAAESPTAFFKLVNVERPKGDMNRPSVNTAGLNQTSDHTVRNKAYWDKVRRENKALYNHPDMVTMRYRDQERLGSKYLE